MLQDIRHFAQAGADGVVIGSLNADGTLNTEQMQEMMEAAGSCAVTMHRAFDVCADPFEALKKSAELGVDTILTSGQEADCLAGCGLLKKLVQLTDQSRSDSRRVKQAAPPFQGAFYLCISYASPIWKKPIMSFLYCSGLISEKQVPSSCRSLKK